MQRGRISAPQAFSGSLLLYKPCCFHTDKYKNWTFPPLSPKIYGRTTLADINAGLQARAEAAGYAFEAVQSNAEAVLIERAQAAMADHTAFIIINPAAYTHTSVALRDALAAAGKPFIEVHLSNVHAREPFRRHSYFSDLAQGVICGLGAHGYFAALDFAIEYLQQKQAG